MSKKIKRADKAEIDRCLNCKRPSCVNCIDCEREGKQTRPPRPIPEGFSEAVRAKAPTLELCKRFRASTTTIARWKQELRDTEEVAQHDS